MTREPDRYEDQAAELIRLVLGESAWKGAQRIAAALRQAADEALERALACVPGKYIEIGDRIRALASPAAAPAAETHTPECHSRHVDPVYGGRLNCNCRPPSEPVAPARHTAAEEAAMQEYFKPAPSAAEKRIAELESALRWALGEEDHFPPRELEQGQYWWRIELRRRAKLAALASPVAQGKEPRK